VQRRQVVIGLLAGLGVPLLAVAWGVVAYFVFSLNETTGTQIRAVGSLVIALPGIGAALAASVSGLGFAIARRPWLRRFHSWVLWSLLAGGLFILWAFVPLPALEPHNCGSVDCADF
jgi:hypothetical protein